MLKVRVGLAQINSTVGDLRKNAKKIREYIEKAKEYEVDVVSFPELALTGYPPEDLLMKPHFIEDNRRFLDQIIKSAKDIIVVVGFIDNQNKKIYNAAAVLHNQSIADIYHKICLPNYGVFDEKRYFVAGDTHTLFEIGGVIFGINVCEDIWEESPVKTLTEKGAQVILNINSSPFHAEKWREREDLLKKRARQNSVIIAYNNMVGGQDELVFDGSGMIVDASGKVICRGAQFTEDLVVADLTLKKRGEWKTKSPLVLKSSPLPEKKVSVSKCYLKTLPLLDEIYQALILGTKDYVKKNGFEKVIIGFSGGIDSSLTAAIAVDALGPQNVIGVCMPSSYTSEASLINAQNMAQILGVKLVNIPITKTFGVYKEMLKDQFRELKEDAAEENLQARIRGNILMALSNKFGYLVLTTGNKSELSVGYTTLYGDLAGGFAVIKDVLKTLVYKLAKYRNSLGRVIPEAVFSKEPSAELRPNQKDSDSLPLYEILDPILEAYVEQDKSFKEIVNLGFPKGLVKKVLSMVDKNEYKRRQAPPGIKITPKAFGKDRRMPITNRYQSY
ncbi:MAG TPA: NAD+ synthase [Candidatus Subteraquimicrobiales bacterium]